MLYLEICFLSVFVSRWFGGRSTSPIPRTSTLADASPQQRRKPLREMTLPNFTQIDSKEGSINETEQPGAVPARLGVLGWFGSSSSINSGTGSLGAVDEPKTQVETVTAERSEPEPSDPEKEEGSLKSREKELEEKRLGVDQKEREVDSRAKELDERERGIDQREKESEERTLGIDQREKELEARKLTIDQRETEVEVRCRELDEREQVAKEGHVEMQRKIEEVERRERKLEEQLEEFEKEREKWVEESNANPNMTEWRTAMETLKKEMNHEIFVERKKAEERELELETRVMKKLTELLAADKDEQKQKKKRWDVSIKPLTR